MSIWALLAALALQLTSESRTVTPVSEAEAVVEFERTCMVGLNDLGRLRSALADSAWGYEEQESALQGYRLNWRSARGDLNHVRVLPGRSLPSLPQCNLTAFTRHATNEEMLREAVSAMLARQVGSAADLTLRGESAFWRWQTPNGTMMTLVRIHLEPDGNQIDLSLQTGDALTAYDQLLGAQR